eukprot:6497908-Pyramimonas_sp.AAC.1
MGGGAGQRGAGRGGFDPADHATAEQKATLSASPPRPRAQLKSFLSRWSQIPDRWARGKQTHLY